MDGGVRYLIHHERELYLTSELVAKTITKLVVAHMCLWGNKAARLTTCIHKHTNCKASFGGEEGDTCL